MHHRFNLITDVASLGAIVTVWAHPDDEAYLAAGLMSIARENGQAVTCITATNGDYATDEVDRARIGRLRCGELAAAMDVIGIDDIALLGMRDGECDRFGDDAAVALIAAVLRDRAPDTIITFGPDGLTGHPDHCAVARWTAAAAQIARPSADVLVPVVTPDIEAADRDINDRFDVFAPGTPTIQARSDIALVLRMSGSLLDRKYRALQAHASQTAGLIDALGEARYREWIARETFLPLARWTAAKAA